MKITLTSLILSCALFSTAQAATIADLPLSQNVLVNDFVDMIVNTPGITTHTLRDAAETYVVNSSDRPAIFRNLVSLFDQVAEETFLGAKSHLTNGPTDRYHRSMESSEVGMYISYVSDMRFRNLNRGGSQTNTVFGRILLNADLLSETEFKTFADNFIRSLKAAHANLPRINSMLKQAAIEEGRGGYFEPYVRTYADLMLLEALDFELPERSKLLNDRIESLVAQTLRETVALNSVRTRVLDRLSPGGKAGRSCGVLFAPAAGQ